MLHYFLAAEQLGTSPLHFASMHGHTDTVSILLRAGISRDARTKVDRTPLHVAAQAGHFEIVQLLLKNNAIVDACDMVSSASRRNPPMNSSICNKAKSN